MKIGFDRDLSRNLWGLNYSACLRKAIQSIFLLLQIQTIRFKVTAIPGGYGFKSTPYRKPFLRNVPKA
jgi:hypothetical protein